MALDITKLENVTEKGRKTTARCPACAEEGMDEKGEHLVIHADGKFGCVLHPGAVGKPHRQRVFALVGIKTHPSRPKYRIAVKAPGDTPATTPGRFGRVFLTLTHTREKTDDHNTHIAHTCVGGEKASDASGTGTGDMDEDAEREARMARDLQRGDEVSLLPMLLRPSVRSLNRNDPNFVRVSDGSLVMALHSWDGRMTANLLYVDPANRRFWDCAAKQYCPPPRFYMLVCEKLNFDPTTGSRSSAASSAHSECRESEKGIF